MNTFFCLYYIAIGDLFNSKHDLLILNKPQLLSKQKLISVILFSDKDKNN